MNAASHFTLNTVDVAIILGSVLFVVGVGLLASSKQDKTARGYFLASGRLPWYIMGAAFVSTSVSSEQIVGTVGRAYAKGMGVANWEWWSLPPYALLILIFIPLYLKNRITTVPEMLTRRYGPICGHIYSLAMLVAYVFIFMVPVLYGGSLAFSELTGWNFHLVLWGTIILIAIYTVKGGLLSVVWTDAMQCGLLLGGGLLLYFLALRRIPGGWAAMAAANPERFHLYHPPGDPNAPFLGLLMGTVGVFLFYQATNQVMVQRVLGARSTWDGIMGIIFAGFINLARPLVTCFLGLIVYHWIHTMKMAEPLANPDTTFPFALKTFAPEWGLRGLILAGFLAAVMSATSAVANSTATIFALDVYKKMIHPQADDRQTVRVGRYASFLALFIAGLVAPHVARLGGIFKYFQMGVTFLSTPFISVILLGLLWKRANYAGAVFGVVGGILVQILVAVLLPLLGVDLFWLYTAFIAQVIIVAGVVVISLSTRPPTREQWEPFLWRPGLLTRLEDGVVRPWHQSLRLWFGLFAAIWFYLYWRYW
jgi:SSS family solute:Na+ symporter